ncbi:carotenoid oxygenase family protein [Nonomuraea mangrovi]|uniref:Dioxygenase n=1 Tax=Nonomuraea mangrovi TaxID=2316207 RepID=A0ABW4SXA3_9ACTN
MIGGTSDPTPHAGAAVLHRWTLDLSLGTVKEEQLDDRGVEFPTFNEDRLGRAGRYLYAVTGGEVVKYDTERGTSTVTPVDGHAGEAVFVPKAGAGAEDEGRLMSIVDDRLLVHEATDLREVASVRLPRRVPAGFHGSWIAD